MDKDAEEALVMDLPAGTYFCHKIDMVPEMNLPEVIENVYHEDKYAEVIVANILLDKFQIGTKKSELQKRILSNLESNEAVKKY